MAQEKLLLIGASIGQVPLLKKAQAKGIHVTVATIPFSCILLYHNKQPQSALSSLFVLPLATEWRLIWRKY